ncbi:MAG: type VI secretion protein [Legionellaceae bacterium]|nr:type VI secretion protein [Legionellaceae bacterium]
MTSKEKYYAEAATWDHDINASLRQSKNRAWIVAAVFGFISVLCLLSLVLVLPLKEFAPYVITQDKATGYIEVTRGLKPGDLSEDEAVTMSNIVRHITARETYDPADLQENFNYVMLTSVDQAHDQYLKLYERTSPTNPVNLYGRRSTISTQIKNISFLNNNTASVRFVTTLDSPDKSTTTHWVAIVAFRYTQAPASLADRFKNPLGFQVTSYRRDQEIISE